MARKHAPSASGTLVVLEHTVARAGRQSARAIRMSARSPSGCRRSTTKARHKSGGRGRGCRCSTTSSASRARASRTRTGSPSATTCPSARRASIRERKMGPAIFVFPDCFTVARRQPVRQLVGDRRVRRLPDARDHPVRRSRVPHARLARASRLLRQIVRRLRRDHPRDEVREALGRDRRPLGRRLLRLRLPPRLAEHAERAREAPRAEARGGRLRRAGRDARAQGPRAGLRRRPRQALSRRSVEQGKAVAGRRARDHERLHGGDLRSRPEGAAAASALPFNLETGERLEARWRKWLQHDPIHLVEQARGEPAVAQGHLHRLRLARPVPHPLRHAASCRCASPKPAFATATRNSTTITRTSTTGWT